MDFGRFWFNTRKKIKKTYKKVKKWFKRYIRLLVRHTKAKDYSVLIYTILAVIAIIIAFVLVGKLFGAIASIGDDKDKKDKKTTTEVSTELDTTEELTTEGNALATQAQVIYDNNKDFLILVNNDNPLDETYTFTHHTLNCGLDMDERAFNDLKTMLETLNTADLHYSIVNAYIEPSSEGDGTFNSGCNEHSTGLALDINTEYNYEYSTYSPSDPTNVWLTDNCYKYGFIVRYPADKVDSTGVPAELWHFRYVGVEAATFMHENNLSLEEFYELLEL